MASAAEEFTVDNNFSPKAGTSKLQWTVPADASPDSKCPICLDKFDNVAYLGHCLHKFCFRCVQEWSKNKAECPLCKQPFQSIFHSVRAENDFEEYVLRPSYRNMTKEYVQGSFASPDGRRFRYRTTSWRRERSASAYSQRSTSLRRTETPPDNGVLFEGLSAPPIRQRDSGIHHILRQEGRSLRKIQESDMINFRRTLYRSGIRVRHIQDGGRYRDISAEFFRRNPACLHRLVPWLKRELTVLFGTHGSLVNIVQHIIMSNVTRYDLESQAFVDDLKPFLLNRTDHFLHEFISFARSPFNMEAFDQHANYDCPAPSYEEGSQSDSSVITISPDEADNQELDANTLAASQAPWDDETPGPSYSSSEQVYASVSSPLNTSDSSDEELLRSRPQTPMGIDPHQDLNDDVDSSSDNCVIVGYVKPLAERTPELVELSSDSEESESEKNELAKKPDPSSCDSDFSSSPHSFVSKDEQINKSHYNSDSSPSPSSRILRSKKEKRSVSSSPRGLSSSMTVERVCSPCSHRLSKKRGRSRSSDSYSYSRDGHDRKSCRKHRGKRRTKSRRSRSRESSQLKDRKGKKTSRTRDNSWSRKSQTVSLSSESTVSRERSRSRSRSSDHGKRRSRSRDRDRYYLRNNYTRRYQWEYTYYSRNRDGYESSYRKRTLAKAHYPRKSSSPEFRIQTFSERTNARKESSHNERRHYHNERHRSRSRSSNTRDVSVGSDRGRCEKPGGKRKYKTRHLEGTHKETEQSYEDSSKGKEECFEKSSKFCESYKNESDSFSDRSSRDRHKKRKKRIRSPSVEIVYEGKTTDTSRHHKKKKKKHRRRHKRHHAGNSFQSSPIVITIETDSDKEPEVKENFECDSHATLITQYNKKDSFSPVRELIKKKDKFALDDEITILDKEYEITCNGDLDNDTKIVDNFPFQETSNEHSSDMGESNFVSGMTNLHSDIESIEIEPSVQLPSPKSSVIETSPERPSLILRLPKHLIEKSCIGHEEKT
ncbi:E3 ubiquitin-protein ligase Topors [Monodelphis domestica]|uniref:E3 ubiquitin-protein ligase Topors n=1 Tax=Monodelphis domestica TaxID=13616 RepID=UPI0024E1C4D0|nr:E3 ubiquitin-protein ligase Topors [Monodelphis domestica]XP_056662607.1 E3 ubiquitin-protein ligase Topors [Monodelphis domestica]